MNASRLFAATAVSLALAAPAFAQMAVPQYTIVDLGRPTGNNVGHADGVSGNGDYVVGRGVVGGNKAFIWSEGSGVTLLPAYGGNANNWAVAVNNSGLAVGMSSSSAATNADGTAYASGVPVMWKNGSATALAASGRVFGINNAGLAVGSIGVAGSFGETAVIFDTNAASPGSTSITALTADGVKMSTALGISDTGLVYGTGSFNGATVALAYDIGTGAMSRVATLDGAGNALAWGVAARDANSSGMVVGYTGTSSAPVPYSWSAAAGLGSVALPAGMVSGQAAGTNEEGWIVGAAKNGVDSNWYPFLNAGGSSVLLSTLVSDTTAWKFGSLNTTIMGLADDGTIVGYAEFIGDNNRVHAFALIPTAVPEPASVVLMLAGLGALGAIARRRHTAAA